MLKWFKKHFIPHQDNDHKPRFLGKKSLLSIAVVVLILEVILLFQVFVVFRQTDFLAQVLPSVLVSLTNQNRETHNVSPLEVNPLLVEAAEKKAQHMADNGYFAHTSPDGVTPWHWLDEAGYSYSVAGENLAVNFFDSKQVAKAWMNSPTHKRNIVDERFTEIGIGLANGVYKGRPTVFVTQFFGTPTEESEPDLVALESEAQEEVTTPDSQPDISATDPVEPDPAPQQEAEPDPQPESEAEDESEIFGDFSEEVQEEVPEEDVLYSETEEGLKDTDEDLKDTEEDQEEMSFSAFQTPIPTRGADLGVGGLTTVNSVLASPQTGANLILSFIFVILLLAFFLAVFINIHVQHPYTLTGALAVIILVGSFLTINTLVFGDVELSQNQSSYTEEKSLIF